MKSALLVLMVALLLVAREGTAQATAVERPRSGGVRLHIGMWTTHLTRVGRGLDANWLLAVGWRGVYGGTFINSFGNRAFAAGIERPFVRSDEGSVVRGLGYRLGLVTGYDERLLGLAAKTPILPLFQITGDVAVGRTGVEVAWTGKVATVGPFMRVAR
ncbi:MAG TPA: hypothetical protein VLH75_04820 [Longimicrobiales bacterium]|nr:hypothetical protein [Longimicrobiales bacterium]